MIKGGKGYLDYAKRSASIEIVSTVVVVLVRLFIDKWAVVVVVGCCCFNLLAFNLVRLRL
jgi:hypothetical protein